MKTVLVTGGAGYIGSHTVVELASSGYRPVILDNFSNSEPSAIANIESIIGSKLSTYKGNIQDEKLIAKIFSEEKIAGVIHFAAFKSVRESLNEPLKYYLNNLVGLIKLLEGLKDYSDLPFVFSSSCTVYGETDGKAISEDAPLGRALSPYGATKQFCERIIEDQTRIGRLKAISLRYFNALGAHPSGRLGETSNANATFILPSIMKSAIEGTEFRILGKSYPTADGTCIRDYTHVVDLARAHIAALDRLFSAKSKGWDVYNVGTGRGTSVLQLVNSFEKISGKKVNYRFVERSPGDAASAFANPSKIQKQLGWKAEKNLEDALADAWLWQQKLDKIDKQ